MSAPLLEVCDLRLRRGPREILRGVSFAMAPGGLTALMGPSGSGKTTVLRVIAALEAFDHGSIRVGPVALAGGVAPPPAALRQLRREVGLVFQFHSLFEHLPALDNVTLAPIHARGVAAVPARTRGLALLASLGVDHRAQALPRELSGGEAQRVAIARALAVDPPLLMMDEPTASLDPARRDELGALLRGLVEQGRTILMSTHDTGFAGRWADRVIALRDGVVTGEG